MEKGCTRGERNETKYVGGGSGLRNLHWDSPDERAGAWAVTVTPVFPSS